MQGRTLINLNRIRADATDSLTAARPNALRALQVEELYGFALVATFFSYFGAMLTLGVLLETKEPWAIHWFAFATSITLYRVVLIWSHDRRRSADPDLWARRMILGNLLAGIQWGILGTVLYPDVSSATPVYRELYTMMVITCFVGGSVTSYAPVKWAHPALALPAGLPPTIYVFFLRDGVHLYAGAAALFFCLAVVYYALKLNRQIEDRLRLTIENRELLAKVSVANDSLANENQHLAHRAEVRRRSALAARNEAHFMAAHFMRSPLPMLECDSDYRLLSWNDATEKLLGYTLDEAHGQSLLKLLLTEEKHAQAASVMQKLIDEHSPASLSSRVITKSGQLLRCTCHLTPVVSPDGGPVRVAVIVSDVEDLGEFKRVA